LTTDLVTGDPAVWYIPVVAPDGEAQVPVDAMRIGPA
jgi:hypothetical protein